MRHTHERVPEHRAPDEDPDPTVVNPRSPRQAAGEPLDPALRGLTSRNQRPLQCHRATGESERPTGREPPGRVVSAGRVREGRR